MKQFIQIQLIQLTYIVKVLAMKKRHFVHALFLLGLTLAASSRADNVRSEIERNIYGCYDTVIFNNSNGSSRGGRVDWRYDYADGSYSTGSTDVPAIGPGQRANVSTYTSRDMSQCKQMKYQFKVLNWRIW